MGLPTGNPMRRFGCTGASTKCWMASKTNSIFAPARFATLHLFEPAEH